MVGAIAASAALLFGNLERHGLWIDELETWEAMDGSFRDVIAWCVEDVHPPLYYLGLKLWVEVAGRNDLTLRLFSAFGALLAVVLVGPVARRWIGASAVVPATLLLALHPAFIELGRVARYYSLLVVVALAGVLALHAAREHGRFRDWALYALSMTAAVHIFYPAAFLMVAHVPLVLGSSRPHAWRRFVGAGAAVVLLSLPWVGLVAVDQVLVASRLGAAELSGSFPGFALAMAASGYTFALGQMLYPWNPAAWCGLLAVGGMLSAGVFLSRHDERWRLAAALVIGVTLVALLVNVLAARTPFLDVPVRALFALPFLVLLLAHGYERLPSWQLKWASLVLLTIAWASAHASYASAREYLNPIHYTPGKEAAQHLLSNAEPGDVVVSARDIGIEHYLSMAEAGLAHAFTREDEAVAALLEPRPTRVWLVTLGRDRTRSSYGAAAERVRAELQRHYERARIERLRPLDARYIAVKEWLLKRPSYRHRLTLELYVRRD